MQNDIGMIPSRGSPWVWFPLAVLLALAVYWAISDAIRIRIEPFLFIPLLTGWLAGRFGSLVASFLLALGLMSLLSFGVRLFPQVSIWFGIPLWVYVLAIFTSMAFARPRWSPAPSGVLEARWRWLRWLALVAVWITVFKGQALVWEISETFQIGINPGFMLLVFTLAASVKWSALTLCFRTMFWGRGHALKKVLTTGLVAFLALALLIHVRWELSDALSLKFGFPSGYALVPVVAFLSAALAILDWRLMVVLLGVFFASDVVVSWLGEVLEAVFHGESGMVDGTALTRVAIRARFTEGSYFDWAALIRAIASVLYGVAIAPFWLHQDPDSLRTRRTPLFLLLMLGVLFFGMPVYSRHLSGTDLMLVGGAAYIFGLSWQVRGIIAGPLIIQLVYLLGVVVRCADYSCGESAYESVNIGFVAFPFAFFGVLSNRYQVPPSDAYAPGEEGDRP